MEPADAFKAAKQVALDVRTYARDHFTPGTLESLNELEHEVTVKVFFAIVQDRAHRAGERIGTR